MAQITKVELVDDLDGSEASETIQFGIDGKWRTIDLSKEHATALRENLEDYLRASQPFTDSRAASPIASARGRRSSNGGSAGTAADRRRQLAAIREWARQNGLSVSDRGRVSQEVLRAFEAAHGSAA